MKKLILGLTLLFGSVICNANNKVVFEVNKEVSSYSKTNFSTSKEPFQYKYKKYRKTRSDKGKKRGSYKKRK